MFSILMSSKRFAPLFWCQFFSAFNDNFLKNSLVFLILFKMAAEDAGALITLAGALFIFPFFLLSGIGGEIADKLDKAVVARRLKLVEVSVSALAVTGFYFHSIPVLFAALIGFGVISALFGPIKYGILPDHLQRSELPAGNALIEGATFIAILTGTIAGGLAVHEGGNPVWFSSVMVLFALLCWGSSMFIPRTGQAAPDLKINPNIFTSTFQLLGALKSDARLWWGGLVVSWFWLVGAVVLSLLPPLIKNVLGGNEEVVTAYLAIFSISIALGSGLASYIAAGRIVLVPTLFSAVILGVLTLDLSWTTYGLIAASSSLGIAEIFASSPGFHLAFDFAGIAIAGGLFIVPAFAAVQAWAGAERRARVIAAVNILNAAFMTAAGIGVAVLQKLGLSTPQLFILLGVANFAVAVVIARTMPTSPFRDFIAVILRLLYRLEVHGLENVAKAGPRAIIALNHVSFLDAAVALSFLENEPVFAIDYGISQRWWVKPFLKLTRAMPLDPTKPLGTRTLINAVREGETLIIFPEGRLTVTGSLMKVYDGAGLIADKADAMVVPVRLKGLEATPFSRLGRGQINRRWFPKVTVTVLEPVKLTIDPELRGKKRRLAAGSALYQIMSDLVFRTTPTDRTLIGALIESAQNHGMKRIALEDPIAGTLSYRKMLLGTALLGRKLMPFAPVGAAVGVLLPNSNGAAVTTLAIISAGAVPAMINFSAGVANIRAACEAAKVTHIVTSRVFIERARLENIVSALDGLTFVYLEDVRSTITLGDKLRAFREKSRPLVERLPSDPAAILFTSGSEGTPKGVVLSHRNILANAAQAEARIDFGRSDKVFNVLPMFHSFGLTVGLFLPLVSGVQVYLYPSPLHYRIVPEMIYGSNATILFGTDTFLSGYARAAHAYDFRSLRYILAGAEPVKETTRRIYMEKFGLRILEGYGITETAPALALNTPMFNRFGTVGKMVPGMELRLEEVPGITEGGRLFVRGPNVMLGYFRAENPGVLERPAEGWHDTGDIVTIDDEGFVTIKGRAKRFAKIGGEMVSLAAIEGLASGLWEDAMSGAASTPDPRKGERIVLLTTRRDATRAAFIEFARSQGASEMMAPSEIIVVDKLPLLGSGKVDHVALTKLVRERAPLQGAA
jgi:acyl-[acyl-carrier-protein]-phospholipid O-acyltransferase/long-chain-fatty-acid--[acyl-carrier-protein] ligase